MSQEPSKEDFAKSYLPLIKGANKVLDTLASVWRYSVIILLVSLSAIGAISLGAFFFVGREVFFTEGVIFLAIAAWIFFRNVTDTCNRCCTADIPRWKRLLSSFIQSNNSVDMQRDGQSIAENLMRVIDESFDWIRLIRRDVFSMLFWPVIAAVIFLVSVYSVDITMLQVTAIALVMYVFVLTGTVYYTVNIRFQGWQERASSFRGYTASALESL